jgi:hypothetical protein
VGGDKALFIPFFLPSKKKLNFLFLPFSPHSSINARGGGANLKFPKFRWPFFLKKNFTGSYFSSQKRNNSPIKIETYKKLQSDLAGESIKKKEKKK